MYDDQNLLLTGIYQPVIENHYSWLHMPLILGYFAPVTSYIASAKRSNPC